MILINTWSTAPDQHQLALDNKNFFDYTCYIVIIQLYNNVRVYF